MALDLDEVTFAHFRFGDHQIVLANGAETESLYTGAEALRTLGTVAYAEVLGLFPDLARAGHDPVPARELVSGRQGRKLAWRQLQNNKPLVG